MTTETQQVQPFADFLIELNDATATKELSASFKELVAAVQLTGKVGTVTYTVKVAPAGRNNGNTVMVTDDIKVKMPVAARSDTTWFVDGGGNVTRHNPTQVRARLKEVPTGIVVDPDETGEVFTTPTMVAR
jgi:protein subunit release factor A